MYTGTDGVNRCVDGCGGGIQNFCTHIRLNWMCLQVDGNKVNSFGRM